MAAEHNTGIYEIRNLVNGKRYVGSAVHFGYRWTKHKSQLGDGKHHSRHLQQSWDKHGPSAFEFNRLIICGRENLILYEQTAMDALKPEYNIAPKAGSCAGVVRTAEQIAKAVATRLSRGGWSPSAQTRAKISASLTGQPGRPHTSETRAKMKLAQQARDHECLRPLWESKRGVPRTDDVRIKLSQANARLTDSQVREIRLRCAAGELQKSLVPEYGITRSCISEIVCCKNYKWVK